MRKHASLKPGTGKAPRACGDSPSRTGRSGLGDPETARSRRSEHSPRLGASAAPTSTPSDVGAVSFAPAGGHWASIPAKLRKRKPAYWFRVVSRLWYTDREHLPACCCSNCDLTKHREIQQPLRSPGGAAAKTHRKPRECKQSPLELELVPVDKARVKRGASARGIARGGKSILRNAKDSGAVSSAILSTREGDSESSQKALSRSQTEHRDPVRKKSMRGGGAEAAPSKRRRSGALVLEAPRGGRSPKGTRGALVPGGLPVRSTPARPVEGLPCSFCDRGSHIRIGDEPRCLWHLQGAEARLPDVRRAVASRSYTTGRRQS